MTPSRPYLLRALYDWIVDNGMTPHIVVDVTKGAIVPQEHVKDDRIVLNVSGQSVQGLSLGNEAVEFKARFGSVIRHIYAPMESVTAIYANENGRGMVFGDQDLGDDGSSGPEEGPPSKPRRGKPKLKIVK